MLPDFKSLLSTIIFISFIFCNTVGVAQTDTEESIRQKVETLYAGIPLTLYGERIYCTTYLQEFYTERAFSPAWKSEQIDSLIAAINIAQLHGLNPKDYHFEVLMILSEESNLDVKADLDLLASDAFLLYASHFLNGKVNPETVDSEWKAIRREGNAKTNMIEALQKDSIYSSLLSLAPRHIGYIDLMAQLDKYKKIESEGGWPLIASGETLKPGMIDGLRVPQLYQRLLASGDMPIGIPIDSVYTDELSAVIKSFQTRHGLDVDGNLGKATLAALNIPVQDRINQILINMERHRWIRQDLGIHYIMVNIANYKMEVFKDTVMTMEKKVIVGKPFRKTPVFSSKMTYIVLNPYWTVPPTILFNDILPELKKNPGYLSTKNIKVLDGYGSDASVLDPYSIDWSQLSQNYFPYVLRQDPGPTNALGVVKFMFPNKYNIYMHDTPSKELFNRADRAFSSGCIRVEKPLELAQYLLSTDPNWDMSKIQSTIKSGEEQTIVLKKPINVHILYLTSWVENGQAHFRKDLYERDQPVLNALLSEAPTF